MNVPRRSFLGFLAASCAFVVMPARKAAAAARRRVILRPAGHDPIEMTEEAMDELIAASPARSWRNLWRRRRGYRVHDASQALSPVIEHDMASSGGGLLVSGKVDENDDLVGPPLRHRVRRILHGRVDRPRRA